MSEIIAWFCINYPNLKKQMQKCEHGNSDINPYHVEGDCWSHTMMVCKIAELKNYDIRVKIAALLHDIAKPKTRKVNPKNKHVQFFGHEELSSKMAKDILETMAKSKLIENSDIEYIVKLVRFHGIFYKESMEDIKKKFNKEFFKSLKELHTCDTLGRFNLEKG